MKTLCLALLLLATTLPPAQAQLFADPGIGIVLPSAKITPSLNAGMRWNDVELSAAATMHPGFATNAGAMLSYRFAGSHVVDDMQSGLLLGIGYGYSWHARKALKNGAQDGFGLVVSLKKAMPTVFGRPMIGELRLQGKIVSLQVAVRLTTNQYND